MTQQRLDLDVASPCASTGAVWTPWNISRAQREQANHHRAAVLWLTGLPGSGKTTLAAELERRLFQRGCQTMLLDGDQLRHGLCGDLGFSPADRQENVRRVGEVARLFFEQGNFVLCALVSPFRRDRDQARERIGAEQFVEIFVACDLDECRRRDPKGLYAAAAAGGLANLTGVGQRYEPPLAPDLVANTQQHRPAELADQVLALLHARNLLPQPYRSASEAA